MRARSSSGLFGSLALFTALSLAGCVIKPKPDANPKPPTVNCDYVDSVADTIDGPKCNK